VLNSTLHHPLIHTIRFARFGNARDDSERYARGFGPERARTKKKGARILAPSSCTRRSPRA